MSSTRCLPGRVNTLWAPGMPLAVRAEASPPCQPRPRRCQFCVSGSLLLPSQVPRATGMHAMHLGHGDPSSIHTSARGRQEGVFLMPSDLWVPLHPKSKSLRNTQLVKANSATSSFSRRGNSAFVVLADSPQVQETQKTARAK